MKNVLYIGIKETFSMFRKNTPKDTNIRLLSGYNLSYERIRSVVLDSEELWAVIINLEEIKKAINNIDNLVEELLSECEDTKICIMCKGYSLTNETLQLLLELGIQYIMPYINDAGNINVYKQLLDENNTNNIEEVFSRGRKMKKHKNNTEKTNNKEGDINNEHKEENNNKEEEKSIVNLHLNKKEPVIISIASCIPRMGATTLALQMLFALNTDKKKVCYIDNTRDNEYITAFLKAWSSQGSYDYENNKFSLIGIDFYYNMNKDILSYIFTRGNYDYILYDYGCIYNDNKKTKFFLNADIKFICGGSKCNEYIRIIELCEQLKNEDVKFLFNFVKNSKQKSISQFLSQYQFDFYFMPFILDEFELQEKTYKILNKIFKFDLYNEILAEIKQKKKGK
mgnify:CR=1 FL=1